MGFICRSCHQLFEEITAIHVPLLDGRVCVDCHDQIEHIWEELSQKGRFTMINDDGTILSIILDIMHE